MITDSRIALIIHCPTLKVWLKPCPDFKDKLTTVLKNIEQSQLVFGPDTIVDCIKLAVNSEVDKIEVVLSETGGTNQGTGASDTGKQSNVGKVAVEPWRNEPLQNKIFRGASVSTADPDQMSYALNITPYLLSQPDKDKIQAFLNTYSPSAMKPQSHIDDDDIPW